MERKYHALPQSKVTVRLDKPMGVLPAYRHAISHGGINNFPLPPKVRQGLASLKPRLTRTFIQEYFHIMDNPAIKYDWSLLDPYLESLTAGGGKIIACVCVKPPVLFPNKNQTEFMPADTYEWQGLMAAMARRYSVERDWVEYWEIGNETDIGENGGCPYLIPKPEDYNAYYRMTADAIKSAAPNVKIGGPAVANPQSPLVEGLLAYCKDTGAPLDFITWHVYSDDPAAHAAHAKRIIPLIRNYYPDNPPETMVTEFGKGFDSVCVDESAFDSYRAAAVMSCVVDMLDTAVDYTFYYHIWDQVFIADQFSSFFENPEIMLTHWNKIPHRMGMFGVCGEVRPVFFAYKHFGRMAGTQVEVTSSQTDLRVIATVNDGSACSDGSGKSGDYGISDYSGKSGDYGSSDNSGCVKMMLVNYNLRETRDLVATVGIEALPPGQWLLTVHKIDNATRMRYGADIEPEPAERRFIDAAGDFGCNVFCPADSVAFITLEKTTEQEIREYYEKLI